MPKERAPARVISPFPGAEWITLASETDVVYLYDEGHFPVLTASAMAETGGAFWETAECSELAERGIVLPLFYTVRGKEDGFHAFVYVGPTPALTLLAVNPLNQTQRGRLSLPTGRLRIETYSALRIGPDTSSAEGVTLKFSPGEYDVGLNQAEPVALAKTWPLLYDYLSLAPRESEPKAAGPSRGRKRKGK